MTDVERRMDVELPETEILDALAHCFFEISKLLAEAHGRISGSMALSGCDVHRKVIAAVESKKPDRVQWVIPNQSAIVRSRRKVIHSSSEELEYAANRYRIGERQCKWAEAHTPIKDRCISILITAQYVLRVDGYHSPMAFMFGSDGMQFRVLKFIDRGQKYMVLRVGRAMIPSQFSDCRGA